MLRRIRLRQVPSEDKTDVRLVLPMVRSNSFHPHEIGQKIDGLHEVTSPGLRQCLTDDLSRNGLGVANVPLPEDVLTYLRAQRLLEVAENEGMDGVLLWRLSQP